MDFFSFTALDALFFHNSGSLLSDSYPEKLGFVQKKRLLKNY